METHVTIIGAGLAGTEAALQLADRGIAVRLVEMRPTTPTPVHKTDGLAELVCSNSLKSMKPDSAAGMLKRELDALGSRLYAFAREASVPAGGALAVDRVTFSDRATRAVEEHPLIELERREARSLAEEARGSAAVILATGPLTSDALADDLARYAGGEHLAFYDAAAPIVMADSLDMGRLFRQSRYEDAADGAGDYLNAPSRPSASSCASSRRGSCSRPASRSRRSPARGMTRRASARSSRSASPTRAPGGAPGPQCSCAPRTPRAKVTTSSDFRPT